jgi:hypothetical protein
MKEEAMWLELSGSIRLRTRLSINAREAIQLVVVMMMVVMMNDDDDEDLAWW